MDIQTARQNVGKPFKIIDSGTGLIGKFDTILSVEEDGTIHGNFIEANCTDCRLKLEQPEALKRFVHQDNRLK